MDIDTEIQSLDKEAERIAAKKRALLLQKQEALRKGKSLEALLNESGYGSPQELVAALIRHFELRVTKDSNLRRKRRRTKVTALLRDTVRQECMAGCSKNYAAKKYEVSYAVISKILSGGYDKLA
ncbi:MAG: hypothetical protein LBP65_03470 [Puniceicoccales bacterium]|nr:hypothetical protein [Puniceicoccales bacterium]